MANSITPHGDLVFTHTDNNCRVGRGRIGHDVFHNLSAAVGIVREANQRLHVKQFRIVVRDGHFQIQVVES